MSRPTLEVADIVRAAGNRFWEHHGSHLAWQHRKVLDAIVRCRTAALGGHRDQCVRCGHQAISYNSCRNRHCPRCQGNARSRWLAERRAELLPVSYFHIVFTLPHELSALALQNKRLLYDLLFRASAATLLELAGDPKHLGADIGFLGVLHTWGQNLHHHPHIHYVVPAGGLAPDGSRWIPSSRRFFLPVAALSRVFRGKFAAGLKQLFLQHKLQFHGSLQSLAEPRQFHAFLRLLFRENWVVYAKPPFGGPEHVLNYLARYTHRVAISNHRLVAFQNDRVSFRWKDYARGGKQKIMAVSAGAAAPVSGEMATSPGEESGFVDRWHYSDDEIRRLLRAALDMPCRGELSKLRPWTYHCLFGLLSVSGLRLGEARSLELHDLDLKAAVLTIRSGNSVSPPQLR
jgi:hypothetical protein